MLITSQCVGAGSGLNCDRLQCLQTAAGSSEASGGFVCHLCGSSSHSGVCACAIVCQRYRCSKGVSFFVWFHIPHIQHEHTLDGRIPMHHHPHAPANKPWMFVISSRQIHSNTHTHTHTQSKAWKSNPSLSPAGGTRQTCNCWANADHEFSPFSPDEMLKLSRYEKKMY